MFNTLSLLIIKLYTHDINKISMYSCS